MKSALTRFLIRWAVSGGGLWIASQVVGSDRINYQSRLGVIVIAGLVLALINIVIKPIVVVFSLPALLFSLGLFMIVINGLMVLLASKLYGPLEVVNFGTAMVAGMIIGLVNYIVTIWLDKE